MNSELLRATGTVLGILLAIPALVVLVRMALFFGRMQGAVDQLTKFAEAATKTLTQHGEQLATLEAQVEVMQHRPTSPLAMPPYHPHAGGAR